MSATVIDLARYRLAMALTGYRRESLIRQQLCRDAGHSAGLAGLSYTECPYPLASLEGCSWIEGWRYCYGRAWN